MIRILQVFTIMNRGGAESMIMNYYRQINKELIQFDFLVHRNDIGAFDDEIRELGGNIYRMPPINPFSPSSYYEELRNFFRNNGDYKIVHSHINTFSVFPLKVAKEFNIPCRITHAHIALQPLRLKDVLPGGEGIKEALKKVVKFYLKRKIHSYSTHHFSCGVKAGNWLYGKGFPFKVMNNAIRANDFIYDKNMHDSYRLEMGFTDEILIGHVGRFTSQKNHSFLLRIFKEIVEDTKNAVLILAGDGPLRPKIEAEARKLGIFDAVRFLGVRSDIPQLLNVFDLFVFPSFYEGLPVTLIEAQAAGVKVFASDTITKEVSLTSDIVFLSINELPTKWAEKILEAIPYKKQNNFEYIKQGNYDINFNTLQYEEFCIEQINNI